MRKLLLAVAALLLWAGTAVAQITVTPRRADDFVNSIGANTHLTYGPACNGCAPSSYQNVATVKQALAYLWPSGATINLREALPYSTSLYNEYADLHNNYGVNFSLGSSSSYPQNPSTSNPVTLNPSYDMSALETMVNTAPGSVVSFEGPNEFNTNYYSNGNISGGANSFNNPSWGTAANIYYYNLLQSTISAHSNLAGVKYIGVTTASGTNQNGNTVLSEMGDQSAHVDITSGHVYFGNGQQPDGNEQSGITTAKNSAPSKPSAPAYITETGYNTLYVNAGFSSGGDDATYAKLMLNDLGDVIADGGTRAYFYELLADNPGTPSGPSVEGFFGMFSVSGDGNTATPKTAAVAIHNLFQILWDTGASKLSFTPSALTYTVGGLPSGARTLAFQQSDGDYYLMFWAEPAIWNDSTHTEISNNASTVTVTLPAASPQLQTFDPIIGTGATNSISNTSTINVSVKDHPVLVRIAAGSVSGGTGAFCTLP